MRLPGVDDRQAWASKFLVWSEILIFSAFLLFRAYILVATPSPIVSRTIVPQPQPDQVAKTVKLKRGDFTVFHYVPAQSEFAAHPKAVILFGSGDGGIGTWEIRVCKGLQAEGYEVFGWDCNAYSKTDYDLDTLQADMNTIAASSLGRQADPPSPVIIGGWSMGAEQAVPTAGGPHPPEGLAGLLLVSPGSRGRFGLRDADRWNVQPTGAGTFALRDFAYGLNGLRVAQWDGNLDLLGSKDWLDSLTAMHKSFGFNSMHDYNGASDGFIEALKGSVVWILSPASSPGQE